MSSSCHPVVILSASFASLGGGYIFWLCPKSEPLTEECFRKIPLRFEGPQILKWNDDSTEEISGTYVTEGTSPAGSMWAMNPLPQGPTEDFPAPCKAGSKERVPAPMANGQYGHNPGPCAGNWPTTVVIMDMVPCPRLPSGASTSTSTTTTSTSTTNTTSTTRTTSKYY